MLDKESKGKLITQIFISFKKIYIKISVIANDLTIYEHHGELKKAMDQQIFYINRQGCLPKVKKTEIRLGT